MKVHASDDFVRNRVDIILTERHANELWLGTIRPDGSYVDFDPVDDAVVARPTLSLPKEAWDAICEYAVLESAGKLPADVLLKERLDIESARVDKLLDHITSEAVAGSGNGRSPVDNHGGPWESADCPHEQRR